MNKENLFYLCSIIEAISQKKQLHKNKVVDYIGDEGIKHIYDYADVFHCQPLEQSVDEISEIYHIPKGKDFSKGEMIDIWDSGEIYARLLIDISDSNNWINNIKEIYNSFICQYIDDINLPIYWQPRSYIKECYLANDIL